MPFKRKRARAIKKETIEMILEASRDVYPNEFGAILRAEEGVITEIMLLPGTLSGSRSAIFQLHMLPIDFTVVGTVHSHPSGSISPSGADVALFQKFGYIHIITGVPFNEGSWRAFDLYGEPVDLEVVD
ncbi:MAG: Mov34/MPN/PAD-1 family protein [Thermoplasmata archaeon]|nr:Mov34/MPN/PAD-1 family protein [Candidatus Thermoplasmatota archaeon]MCK4948812.1 Mov34/MPN/PAD-1 family protein [Thermoplasmata archaeon]